MLGGPNLLVRLKERVRNIQKMPGEFSNTSVSVYSTVGAARQIEPNHAGKTGGASAWTTFTPVKMVLLRYQLKIVILIQFWQSTLSAVAQGGIHLKKSSDDNSQQTAKIVRLFSRLPKVLFIS